MQLKKRLCDFTALSPQYPKHMLHVLCFWLVSQEWIIYILIALSNPPFQSVFVKCLTTDNLAEASISNVTFPGETK